MRASPGRTLSAHSGEKNTCAMLSLDQQKAKKRYFQMVAGHSRAPVAVTQEESDDSRTKGLTRSSRKKEEVENRQDYPRQNNTIVKYMQVYI